MGNSINVGIDLGTTNTLVCMEQKGKPKCLKFKTNGDGSMLPSVLYYKNGKTSIGKSASDMGLIDPNNEIRSSKTFMGKQKTWIIDGKTFTPTDVATEILSEVKATVCKAIKKSNLDESATIDAVITVPAYFNTVQVEETKKAGIRAGLNVKRIITEPMAAAIAYISEDDFDRDDRLLFVMDLGGGTFDLSLLQYDGSEEQYNAICLGGDSHLGGDDFDQALVQEFKEYIRNEIGLDLSTYSSSGLGYSEYYGIMAKLRKAAEEAKINLSDFEDYTISIPTLCDYKGKSYDFNVDLTRSEFDTICEPLYRRIFNLVEQFITENHIDVNDIWRVALVGGSCNVPYIKDKASNLFKDKVYSDLDLSTLVVRGAFTVSSSINGVGVDAGSEKAVNYSDILSHSLGIELIGEEFAEILPRFKKYPCEYTKTFTTTFDYQDIVRISVYETKDIGTEDTSRIENCTFYGSFELHDIERARAGVPQIDITFEFDESRILTVTAMDQKTKSKKRVVIKSALDYSSKESSNG